MAAPSATPAPKLYFAYGSNLSLMQMIGQRCPHSTYVGIGLIRGWKWIINERGYANVVEVSPQSAATNLTTVSLLPTGDEAFNANHRVWGLIYSLPPADEIILDIYEGVPHAYGKEAIDMEFWSAEEIPDGLDGSEDWFIKEGNEGANEKALVYIDRNNTSDDEPNEEYIYRMARGIMEAGEKGWPTQWARKVMRKEFFGGADESV